MTVLPSIPHIERFEFSSSRYCARLVAPSLSNRLCTGGELFDSIIAKSKSAEGHYSEHDAATLIRKALSAIDHCHSDHDIVHRDLKPENFLFKGPGPGEGDPTIIDFGLSKMVDTPDEHMATRVGTPYYIAPEVLGRNYGKPCDIWSIGVITCKLCCCNNHDCFKNHGDA